MENLIFKSFSNLSWQNLKNLEQYKEKNYFENYFEFLFWNEQTPPRLGDLATNLNIFYRMYYQNNNDAIFKVNFKQIEKLVNDHQMIFFNTHTRMPSLFSNE